MTGPNLTRRGLLGGAAALSLAGLLSACSSAKAASRPATVNIGYFPNVTHAPGLIADQAGFFESRLQSVSATASTKSFNAGPDVVQAILSGSLDVAYIGPNPTITAYLQSRTAGVRVVAGATSGGASLVVKPEIRSLADLKGKRLATPQLGNTQDVGLRYWLTQQGLTATTDGGGDVAILPQANSAAVQSFSTGAISGGWLPEPYASQLVKAGGVVLVDERTLWPDRAFVTTHVIARRAFAEESPETLRAVLEAHLDALDLTSKNAAAAQQSVAAQIKKITTTDLDPALLAAAWGNLAFTADPLAATLKQSADHAAAVGLLPNKPSDGFASLWKLDQLNVALQARGLPAVSA